MIGKMMREAVEYVVPIGIVVGVILATAFSVFPILWAFETWVLYWFPALS